jgi:TonB family protein
MQTRLKALALFVILATPAFAQEVGQTLPIQCVPGKPLRTPAYPVEMASRGAGGTVVLDITIDSCGRILDAVVKEPSKKAFNEAAMASVKGVTLSESQRSGARDGRLLLPIVFSMKAGMSYQVLDWPNTHRRPRYVIDEEAMIYATADEANAAIKAPPDHAWPSPYPVHSRFVQVGEPGAREFWLFILKDAMVNVAARYRPVMQEGKPVVKLALRCSDTPEACTKAQEFLLRGLPFAKASN